MVGGTRTLITRKVFPPCTNTSPKLSSGSGPDRSSPSASLLRDRGDPSTTTLIGNEAIGAPVCESKTRSKFDQQQRTCVAGTPCLSVYLHTEFRETRGRH